MTVYIRAKIGFCNCATGVSDDEELDRISDFDLARRQASPPRRRAADRGRLDEGPQPRLHDRRLAIRSARSALSVGFNDRCDAIVATAVLAHERPAAIEPAVIEFLNSKTVVRWAEVTLGL